MPDKYFMFDKSREVRPLGQAAITATGYIGTQWDQGDAVATDIAVVINVEAVDIANSDETYTFRLVGSNQANRSDAQVLDILEIGDAAALSIETVDVAAGDQFVMRGRSERRDLHFRYVDLHLTVGGTTPSITFGAFVTKEFG